MRVVRLTNPTLLQVVKNVPCPIFKSLQCCWPFTWMSEFLKLVFASKADELQKGSYSRWSLQICSTVSQNLYFCGYLKSSAMPRKLDIKSEHSYGNSPFNKRSHSINSVIPLLTKEWYLRKGLRLLGTSTHARLPWVRILAWKSLKSHCL